MEITLPLYFDYVNRRLVTVDGSTYTFPTLTEGDTLRLPLHILERLAETLVERDYAIRAVNVSIGKTIEPPTAGQWSLRLEDPDNEGEYFDGAALALNPSISDLTTQLTALFTEAGATIADVSLAAPGCWTFSTNAEAALNLQAGNTNTLFPVSFVRVNPYEQGGKWWYEIRLVQAPVAWNENGHERILPPAPDITRIRAGAAETESSPPVNELQDLFIPPNFRGTYFFRFGSRRSKNIGFAQGPDDAAEALNGMFADSKERFDVTSPEANHGQIEFLGPLEASPQDLLTTEVYSHPPGVVTVFLDLGKPEMRTALRASPSIVLPLEIEIEVVDNAEDLEDTEVAGRIITLCQLPVTIVRQGIWPGLAAVRAIDWQRPSPRSYLSFNPSQLIPGQQHYPQFLGNGASTAFTVDHDLGTKVLAGPPLVCEAADGGRIMTANLDFVATIDGNNALTFTFPTPPANNSILVVITTAGPVSKFIDDLHIAPDQVDGLQDLISELEGRLEDLEDLAPSTSFVSVSETAPADEIEIPDSFAIAPNARIPSTADPASLIDATSKVRAAFPAADVRPPGLLPAIHAASVTEISALPAPPTAGVVYKNTGSGDILIPGGLGRRGRTLKVNEFAAFDGRKVWYHLTRGGSSSTSYFPSDFEGELVPPITFETTTWRAGQVFTLEFDLSFLLVRANTNAEWALVIEHGTVPSDASPATTTRNLQNVVWNATPLLTQPLIVSALAQKKHFGCRIKRSASNVMSADVLKARAWSAADSAPSTAQFVVRVRMVNFDTENAVTGATGYALAVLTDGKSSIA